MKRIYVFLLSGIIILNITSCSKYYINTISSTNIPQDETNGIFKLENDSVCITYNFYGENAPVHITVQNKLNTPLYIDWSRSALIIKGHAVSYLDHKVNITADLSGYNWSNKFSSLDGTVKASADLPQGVSFIPPHSFIEKTPLLITDSLYKDLPDSLFKDKDHIYLATGAVVIKSANFTKESSPLSFKSFLTLYSDKDGALKRSFYQHEFYISKSTLTHVNPKRIAKYINKTPGLFYTSKLTGYGKTMAGVAVATAIAGAAAAESTSENTQN